MGNGYLGEKLLPLWLSDAGNTHLWEGEVSLLEYVHSRVFPAAAVFLNAGPAAGVRVDRGRTGMEYTNGLLIALQLAHETDVIDAVLRREIGSTADNVLVGYRDRIRTLHPAAFTLHARAFVPARSDAEPENGSAVGRRLAYRVFLPAGVWTVQLDGDGIDGGRVRMGSERSVWRQAGSFRWQSATSGWQLLELSGDAAMTLRRIRFERVTEGTGAR
jgi:hypothetical protein